VFDLSLFRLMQVRSELRPDTFAKQANKGIRPISGASLYLYSSSIKNHSEYHRTSTSREGAWYPVLE